MNNAKNLLQTPMKVTFLLCFTLSAISLWADAQQDRIDAAKREDQRLEQQRLEQQRIEDKIQEQKLEDARLDRQREDQRRLDRKLDDERWDRAHGR